MTDQMEQKNSGLEMSTPTLTFEPFAEEVNEIQKEEKEPPKPVHYEEEDLLTEQEKAQVESFAGKIELNNTTMILVTHDIDEAIYLSNRIVIMTPRPGRISEVLTIDETFPRNRGSEEFLKLRKKILERFNLARVKPNPEYFI